MRGFRYIFIIIGACCVLMIAVSTAFAIPEISTKLDTAYVTKYVWRGLVANQDPAVQPSLTFSHPSGASLNIWGSADSTGINGAKDSFTEVDYTLNYAWAAKAASMNAGVVNYTFPHTSFESTSEVYASACFGGALSPSVSVNYDFDQAKGFYASLGGGYNCTMPWKKGPATNLNLSGRISLASANYNSFYFSGVHKTAFTDVLLSASVPMTISKTLTLTPSLNYSRILNGKLRNAVAHPDNIFGALTASVAF